MSRSTSVACRAASATWSAFVTSNRSATTRGPYCCVNSSSVFGSRAVAYTFTAPRSSSASEIAQSADVPPGNVYYYFKTKDELVGAAIDAHAQAAAAMLTSLERHRTPKV